MIPVQLQSTLAQKVWKIFNLLYLFTRLKPIKEGGGVGNFGVNKILTLFAHSHTVAHLLNKFWRDGGN